MPSPETRTERADAIVASRAKWGLYLFLFIVAGAGMSLGAYALVVPNAFHGSRGPIDRPVPPNPQLQDNWRTRADLAALRRREDEVLTTSGPSLYHSGRQRIPISAAIDRIAARGGR